MAFSPTEDMRRRNNPLPILACLLCLAGALHAQTGTGLSGKYYDGADFTTLKTTRTDATVNFSWGTAIPTGTALTSGDSYSVVWTGQIEPAYSELYTFYVTADDGARLWVDDQMIVGRTFYQGNGEMRGQIRLKAGHRANVRLEYFENSGNASVKLEWASASQARQVVPAVRLYTTTEVPNGGSLMREVWTGLPGNALTTMTSNASYPNKPASRDFITSFECIAQSWEENFGTRVTGYIRAPASGNYTFAVSGDEVAQLYLSTDATAAKKALIASVGNATAFRQWDSQPSQQSGPRALVAGQKYYVELLHKEGTGSDHWSVGWKKPGDAAISVIPGTALMMPGTDNAQPATANFFDTLATEHPRLGVSRERFLWLKQMWLSPTSSAAKTRAQAVINSAAGDVTAALVTQRAAQDRIQRLALAWWITGDSKYAEAAWNNINNSITNGDWADPWKGVEDGVVAFGYDWLYPYWTQARKDAMVSCMVNKGFNPGWTDSYGNNIGVIINSGHLMAILAVGTTNESAAEAKIGSAISRLNSKIEKFNANAGAWVEGTDYGIFTKWGLGQAMPAMECALGSTFGLSKIGGVSKAAREPLTIASNTRQRFTFSDVGTGSEAAIGWANWWARRFNALETFDYSRQIGNSPLNALTLPETTISPATAGLNPDTAFRGPVDSTNKVFQEVVTLRENWTDSKATFVGGMGGTYYDHGMLQSGTFQLSARGVKWFLDLSSESYDVPNHNTTTPNANGRDRWDYYRNRAEGHNTIVINPNSGPDRTWNAPYAPLTNFQSAAGGQRSFAVWDLKPTMIATTTRVNRGIQLLGKRHQVLVQDEIVTPSASTVWWFAHFNNGSTTVTISPDGTSVTLQQGTERLWGKILSGNGTWTVRAAQPLPTSPAPPEAYTNATFSKLAINLTGVTNTTLAVWFVPLAPGEGPPADAPAVTPMSTWNLVSQNEAPVAKNASVATSGDAPVDVALSTFATDDWTASTQLTYTVGGAVGGTLALLPDGRTARFTPTPGFTGTQSFTFTATDADGVVSNAGVVTIGSTPVVTNWTAMSGGSWSVGANWQGAVAPTSGRGSEVQFFNGQTLSATTVSITNNLGAGTQLNRLLLGGTGNATTVVNLAGDSLKLVTNGAAAPAILLSGSTAGFRYNVANGIFLDDQTTVSASGAGTFVFSGAISGDGGLTSNGTAGTLILAGNNTYSGPTTISEGTLQIGNDGTSGSLGTGAVINNGTLRFDRSGSFVVTNNISGTGGVTINGVAMADVISLTGDNTFSGTVNIAAGSLRITDPAQLGDGVKSITAAGTACTLRLDGSAGPVVLPANFSILTSNPNGAILNEAGDNEILGNVTLTAGAGSTRISSAAGSLTIDGTVTSNYTGRGLDLRGAGNGTINGKLIDGTGNNTIAGFSKNDAGTWTLNGNNAITCGTTVSGGTLVINGSHASGNVTVASGATLAGRGTLNAATTVTGTLAPGDAIGTLNFGSTLSFGAASKLRWEAGTNSIVADQAVAAGAVSVTSGAKIDIVLNRPGSTVNFLNAFWRSARTFPVITGSALSGAFAIGTVTADAGGRPVSTYGSFTLQTSASGTSLVWTPIHGFPVINDPAVTITSPAAQLVSVIDAAHELRVRASTSAADTILWSTVDGPDDAGFENSSTADTKVQFPVPGTYVLRCTVYNQVGSSSRDITVEVAPDPSEVSVREGVNSVSAPATFIRGDSTTWNSGSRDQILVGKNNGGCRAVFSFPIPPEVNGSLITQAALELTTASTGSGTALGTLEAHRLLGTFTEGTGDGATATSGNGTGADWLNRSYAPATPWAASGGSAGTDYESATLSTAAGFDAGTTAGGTGVVFGSTPAFVAAVSNAAGAAQPLGLFVKMSGDTSAGSLFARFASDDHATVEWRPELRVTHFPHLAPILDPGTVTAAVTGTAVTLTGSSTNGTPAGWTYVSGPGTVFFLNATPASATVLFTKPGSHLLRFTGTNANGESSRMLAVEVTGTALTGIEMWRQTHFGTIANTGAAADTADPDGDGEANLLEFATGQNPNARTSVTTSLMVNGPNLEFTYTRSKAAVAGGVTFAVMWSDTLQAGSWSSTGVTESVVSDDGTLQSVKATIPAASGSKRFVRLKIVK